MKTAISVPNDTFERAERAARQHGMNRSEFYATAAERYVVELEAHGLTDAIDVVLESTNGDSSYEFAIDAGRTTLSDVEW